MPSPYSKNAQINTSSWEKKTKPHCKGDVHLRIRGIIVSAFANNSPHKLTTIFLTSENAHKGVRLIDKLDADKLQVFRKL